MNETLDDLVDAMWRRLIAGFAALSLISLVLLELVWFPNRWPVSVLMLVCSPTMLPWAVAAYRVSRAIAAHRRG